MKALNTIPTFTLFTILFAAFFIMFASFIFTNIYLLGIAEFILVPTIVLLIRKELKTPNKN